MRILKRRKVQTLKQMGRGRQASRKSDEIAA
jgi:hypothetical protein